MGATLLYVLAVLLPVRVVAIPVVQVGLFQAPILAAVVGVLVAVLGVLVVAVLAATVVLVAREVFVVMLALLVPVARAVVVEVHPFFVAADVLHIYVKYNVMAAEAETREYTVAGITALVVLLALLLATVVVGLPTPWRCQLRAVVVADQAVFVVLFAGLALVMYLQLITPVMEALRGACELFGRGRLASSQQPVWGCHK
jgi:hypothetical protein